MRPAPAWSIADIIDFEYLLSVESGEDRDRLEARDARIFREKIEPALIPGQRRSRRALFREWLDARRSGIAEALPGAIFSAGWRLLITLGILAGLGTGAGVTVALLRYEKQEPINVAAFLGWTLGVQWVILALAAAFWLLRRSLPELRETYPLQGLLWLFTTALRQLPGEQRDRLRAGLAVLAQQREIYGSLAVWPLVIVTQLFAVAFNVAVLGAMLIHVAVVDTRFGWQTTLGDAARSSHGVVPEQVHRLVQALALPWAWAAPDAQPTLEQIGASRYAPGQELEALPAEATRAWWRFIFLAIACYGLVPRVGLLIFAGAGLRRTLRGATFDHAEGHALFRRLTGPIMQPGPDGGGPAIPDAELVAARAAAGARCFGLIADDAELTEAQLADYLRDRFGWRVAGCARAQIDHPSGNAAALEELTKCAPNVASVVLATRSRRAPIKAIALFLQKVAAAAGPKPERLVLLVGPKLNGAFAPVTEEEVKHWRNFSAINRLQIGIEKWTER